MAYASNTTVPISKSRAEIEQLVFKYAGRDTTFSFGQMKGMAAIVFTAHGRQVKFTVPTTTFEEGQEKAKHKRCLHPTNTQIESWRDKEERRRWRALLLIIKAKLEAVASGIHTFEQEFLAHIVVSGDTTVYDRITQGAAEHRQLLPPIKEVHR
jgi:hypothetical protein